MINLIIPHRGTSIYMDASTFCTNNDITTLGISNAWTIMLAIRRIERDTSVGRFLTIGPDGGQNQIDIIDASDSTTGDPLILNMSSQSPSVTFKNYRFFLGHAKDRGWMHLVFSWDGTNPKGYMNGVQDNNPTKITDDAGSQTDVHGEITLSRTTSGGQKSKVFVNQLAIWDTALTSSQVTQLWNNGHPQGVDIRQISLSNLKHWWKFGADISTIENACKDYQGTLNLYSGTSALSFEFGQENIQLDGPTVA